jgi:hypothetical protein
VCGMLIGAGLSRAWSHDRAHRFFSGARWSPDELGLAVAKLVVALLVPAGAPVTVAVDDTLFRRRGKKVWAVSWFHHGSVPGPAKTGYGNNWVIAAVVVRLPMISRPVAIPVLAKLVIKGTSSASRLWLARRMAAAIAGALPGRDIHVVADSAYAGGELKKLPARVTWTTRLRKDAALYGLPPARTGSAAGPGRGETGSRPWQNWPPPRTSRRSPSSATARAQPSTPPPSPACGTRSSASARSPSCSFATSPRPATTWPWSPPMPPPPPRRSSNATPPGGALRWSFRN